MSRPPDPRVVARAVRRGVAFVREEIRRSEDAGGPRLLGRANLLGCDGGREVVAVSRHPDPRVVARAVGRGVALVREEIRRSEDAAGLRLLGGANLLGCDGMPSCRMAERSWRGAQRAR